MNTRVVGSLVFMLVTLVHGIRAVPWDADAAPPTKIAKIGFLSLFGNAHSSVLKAFRQGLRELGYVEGQGVIIEDRWAQENPHRLADFAAELVRLKVDVIVAARTLAIRAAKTATTALPIVMVAAGDPVGTGLITSLAHPGGNITGLATLTTELSGKRLELLKEALPHLSHVAVLWNAADRAMALKFGEIQGAAQALGVTLQHLGVRDASDVDWALTMMTQRRPEALFIITDALDARQHGRLLDFATAHQLPVMYELPELGEERGLMAYGPRYQAIQGVGDGRMSFLCCVLPAVDIGVTVLGGQGGMAMRHQHGVLIYLTSVERRMQLTLSVAGVDITLQP